ncbi:prepilin-type N-terminal cleavage/methylation domain-containing protein [Quadrisphaera granulorum]|uniref:Prepilin-type N-terminal cleavage/methylation domain-containing protein n=1 Tax=Quadrisphaera granulorum TaxID=317664 RepID=A0A315ZTD9_9ACTN|nr:prepilin-type N-terminal cleavage/methylation domain-containing protein [Quadrisphaera granulorum]PWJ47994.1 prepilin-type N-terminal cleavage/methylation domain-containing protein [Quadrisphaera granulorum]SZE98566.1 prepilin-type N-terminal cleavage/methylation domain-containing protein [Quadrisphaera granulorum]
MLARIRKSTEEKDAGFTLVELLVVMIIIGILAAIAVPVFLNQRKKAVDTSIKSDITAVAQEMQTAYVDAQTYSGTASFQDSSAVVPDVKTSGGNVIKVKLNAAPATATAFCVIGYNTKGTAISDSVVFQYDSATGGLKAGAAGAREGTCA